MVAVVLNPGWGDTFQANKAGLTEAGDVFVINKAKRSVALDLKSDAGREAALKLIETADAVSYTHLTLPTICSV